jgi:hypothetical protein
MSWPVEKVVADRPDTMKAAEIMSAMISLRTILSPRLVALVVYAES